MGNDIEPEILDALMKIGGQVKILRTTKTDLSSKELAKEIEGVSKNTILRIEQGTGENYNIVSLLKILYYYPGLRLSTLFKKAGL